MIPTCWGATGLLISTVFRAELIYIHGNLGGSLWPDLGSSRADSGCDMARGVRSWGQEVVVGGGQGLKPSRDVM